MQSRYLAPTLTLLLLAASSRFGSSQPICNAGEVRATDPTGTTFVFGTIQDAVDAAGSGWRISVGPGFYAGVVVIDRKGDLTISTDCGAIVGGFRIQRSSQIAVQGFDVDASSTGENGITLLGGINQSDSVVIANNDIHDAGTGRSGISIARDNTSVTITGNEIHDNDRNGIVFIDSTGGPNFVAGNDIVENGWNGVRVNRQHDVTITNNNISGNGTTPGSTGGRYGVLRERVSGAPQPEGITLLFNRIEGNQGVEISQQSSLDLANYDQMLDASDSGNVTTSGAEAASTGLLFDCNLFSVWQTVDDFQLVPGQAARATLSAAIDTNPNPVVDDGNVFVTGLGEDAPQNRHGIVRRSIDGGLTWSVVRDIPPAGTFPLSQSISWAVESDANGNIYLSSSVGTGTQVRWTLELSSDRGANWQEIDSFLHPDVSSPLGNAALPFGLLVVNNSDVYATGHANDPNNFFRWVTRRKLLGDSAFNTVDSHDQQGTPATPISMATDSIGNLFSVGAIWSPLFRWTVRHSPTGAPGTWTTVDQFVPAGGGDSRAKGILVDSTENVLVAGDGGSPSKAFLRRSAPGGLSWEASPIYTFQLSPSGDTFVTGFEKDSAGNLFLMTTANDGVSNRWIVQRSTDEGQSFQTIDDFVYPGLIGAGAHSLVEGQVDDRSLYVSGEAGDLLSGTSRWVVRKQPCLSPRALTGFEQVAAAVEGAHSCGIANDGSLSCWGRNQNGQIGNGQSGTDVEFATAVVNLAGTSAMEVGTGSSHTCATVSAGGSTEVRCWGSHFYGQLGIGPGAGTATPVSVPGTTGSSVSLAVGANHTCAIVDGVLKCSGRNDAGQLGVGDQFNRNSLAVVSFPVGSEAIDVAAGFNHTCAVVSANPTVDSDNEVWCWGDNSFDAVGVGGKGTIPNPTLVSGTQGATRVTAGQHLSCALIDGGVKCWGENSSGQLGRGTSGGSFAIPMSVLSLEPGGGKGVSAIDAGDDHVCAIVQGGLKCWGDNRMGQTGNGQLMTPITVPVPVAGYGPGSSLVALSAGEQYTCASNGYVTCWGNGTAFRRGDGLGVANEVVPHPALSEVP